MIDVRPVCDGARLRDFLALPGNLHRLGTYNPAAATERALLDGSHVLSSDRHVTGWVAYRDGEPAGRIGLTRTKGPDGANPTAYVGFLEASDLGVSAPLFDAAKAAAADTGQRALVGPLDSSFWLKYRLKVHGFDETPYLTEPLNPPHHQALWEQAGFAETDRYRSAIYNPAPPNVNLPRFAERRRRFESQGYQIGPPQTDWAGLVSDMHGLIHDLYGDFPGFEAIPRGTFADLFDPLRHILDPDLVTMAYRDGRAEGFLVCLPDFGVALQDPNIARRLTNFVRLKRNPHRFVLAYLGARHPGLGAAISQRFMRQMSDREAPVVGALTHVGKASEGYAADHLRTRNEYVLLRHDL